MNFALGIFLLIVVLLLIVLFYLLMMSKDTNNKIKKELPKNNTNRENIDLNNLAFPKNIENMNSDSLFKATKVIFDSYKSLDYANKLPSSMDKIEWHTWQVSILLRFLKSKNNFFVLDNNKIFHDVIFQLKKEQIEQDMQRIFRKYLENVNVEKDRDTLSKDVIWTARDVTIIFFKIIDPK